MIVLVGLGLIRLFEAIPALHLAMKVASVLYLVYLAWKIAHAAAPGNGTESGSPMTFLQAAAFQWVNPKAWFMALTAISVYAPETTLAAVALTAAAFAMVNLPSVSVWTVLGVQIRRVLTNPRRLQIFNWTMAALLIGSLVLIL